MKSKILYVISNTCIGGAETVLKRLIREIDKSRFEVHILITHTKGALHDEYEKHSDSLLYGNPSTLLHIPKYDIIHFFNWFIYYNLIPPLKKKYPDTKIYCSVLANLNDKSFLRHVLTIRKAKPFITALVSCCSINDNLIESKVIYDGVPVNVFVPKKKRSKTVAWMARLSRAKKIGLIPQIARRLPDYMFTMIGDKSTGEYRNLVRSKPKNLRVVAGISEQEVADILGKSQFFIFTSHIEAMPLSILEAMSCGCCVISEDVGKVSTVIKDRKTGFLIERNDLVQSMVYAIKFRAFLPRVIGNNARALIVKDYSLKGMVENYTNLYNTEA